MGFGSQDEARAVLGDDAFYNAVRLIRHGQVLRLGRCCLKSCATPLGRWAARAVVASARVVVSFPAMQHAQPPVPKPLVPHDSGKKRISRTSMDLIRASTWIRHCMTMCSPGACRVLQNPEITLMP